MRTVSIAVPASDLEAFQEAAQQRRMPVETLIHEALVRYQSSELAGRAPLRDVPVLRGPRLIDTLPSRHEVYDEAFGQR